MNAEEWQKRILKGPLFGNETEANSKEQGEDCPLTTEGPTEQDNTPYPHLYRTGSPSQKISL